jgi:hypothetical protein
MTTVNNGKMVGMGDVVDPMDLVDEISAEERRIEVTMKINMSAR